MQASECDASASECNAECERVSAMPMPMRAKSDKVANGRIRCLGAYRVSGGSSVASHFARISKFSIVKFENYTGSKTSC